MASQVDFAELVLIGMEFCGSYCLDPTNEEGMAKRVPLTNRARIEAFLDENAWARGGRATRIALQYVMDGAASPMESATALVLTLPYKRGGYGLPQPKLNWRIDLDKDAAKLCDNSYCVADLCWPDHHLVLEYLGVQPHEGEQNMIADRGRTLALEQMGWEVIEITKEQAMDLEAFELIVRRIAKKLGKRLSKAKLGPIEERKQLFDVLYQGLPAVKSEEADLEPGCEDRVFGRRA